MFIGTSIFQIFPRQLLILFSSTPQMVLIGIDCLRIISLGFMFSGIVIMMCMVFQVLGDAQISLIIYFSRLIVLLLPLAFILSKLIGLVGVWMAIPIAELVSFIVVGYFAIKVYREKIRDLEKDNKIVCLDIV